MFALTKLHRLSLSFILALLALTLAWATLAHAGSPGDLDTSFGGTGVVTTSITAGSDGGFSTVIQPDEKIVVAGVSNSGGNNGDFTVIRYTITGSLDTDFNSTGIVTTTIGDGSWGFAVAVQDDGKIVVAGNSGVEIAPGIFDYSFAVARYTITGALDTDFNTIGIVTTSFGNNFTVGQSLALQPDNKIIVGGYLNYYGNPDVSDIAFVRYTITGSLDTTFNSTGIVTTSIGGNDRLGYDRSIVIQPDGKIIAVGDTDADLFIGRYTITGSLDTSFNSTGVVTYPDASANSVALQPDGKIVVAGTINGDFALFRYKAGGTLDTDFNGTGVVTTPIQGDADTGLSVAIQPDGKIVVTGFGGRYDNTIWENIGDFALVRYNSNGSLDAGFNGDGIVTTSITSDRDYGWSAAIQPDGNIVVGGWICKTHSNNCDFAVARYLGKFTAYLPIILKAQ